MGQAKARGTREQRVLQAQECEAIAASDRVLKESEIQQRENERFAAMPPEERKEYSEQKHRRNMARANMIGMLLALGSETFKKNN